MVETRSLSSDTAPATVMPDLDANRGAPRSCNLHADLTDSLGAIAEDLRRFGLRVELAVLPDLTVRSAPGALRPIIRSIILHVGTVAPGQRMLIAGMRRPAGVAVVFTFEDGGRDLATQESALRSAQQQAALLGASLVIDVRSGIATTVTLILRNSSV